VNRLGLPGLAAVVLAATVAWLGQPGEPWWQTDPLHPAAAAAVGTAAAGPVVRVVGNRLVDGRGRTVRLLGVNRSGTQYACVEGWGIFDGPVGDTAVQAIAAWGPTAVRVSLNEDCWLGINGVPARYSGPSYRRAISAFVNRLLQHRLYVILDLHWNAPGRRLATDQEPMADRDHAPAFWRSVASAFRLRRGVLFDLYNEPYPDHNRNTVAAWRCVRDGGRCPGVPFVAAGSRELLAAVRSSGAKNVVLVGGPQYAGVVGRWLTYAPSDPAGQIAASLHVYGPDWSPCWRRTCWDAQVAPLARRVPVVVGEMGDKDCDTTLIDPLMAWADRHGVSYLAWSWITGDCADEPALITRYDGTPTPYGSGLRRHLRALRR
jgi:hypothetical protein